MIYQVNALEWEESVRYDREGTIDTLSTPALEPTSAYDIGQAYARIDNGWKWWYTASRFNRLGITRDAKTIMG